MGGVAYRAEVAAAPTVERVRQAMTRVAAAESWPVMAGELVPQLRRVVPFDSFCAATFYPWAPMPAGSLADNDVVGSRQQRFWQIEMLLPDVNKTASLVRTKRPVAVLSAATGGDLVRSQRWDELLGPGGIGDELRAGLVADGQWWGSVTLFRERNSPRFTDADAAAVGSLVAPMAAAARASWTAPPTVRTTADEVPGTLLLTAEGAQISATPSVDRWFDRLDPGQREKGTLIYAMTARIAAAAAEPCPAEAVRSLVRGIDGSWIELVGSRLVGPAGTATVAITVQAARPEAVTDLLLYAYALTEREREIALLAVAGRSTADIGAELFLSRHTVADHLKALFAKTGVHSRAELAQRLTGLSG